jgi:hypothetical protein
MLGGEGLETGKAAQAQDARRIRGRVLYQSGRRLWHASSRYRRQRGSRSARLVQHFLVIAHIERAVDYVYQVSS